MKKTPTAKEYFDAHPHYDNFCPWGGTPWYSSFNDAVMKFAEAYSASSHSEPELVKLRRILRELVDECTTCGSPSLGLIDKAEAALASTQNENLSSGEAK